MMAALAVVPTLSLRAIEERLAALADTAELVPAEQEDDFFAEFESALLAARDKRDRVGQFMAHLEAQIDSADREMKRLADRKARYARLSERLEQYVIRILENQGPDEKGRYQKLEGETVTFAIAKCPESVEVTDAAAVPLDYKTAAVKLPAREWEAVLDALELEDRACVLGQAKVEYAVSKTALKEGLKSGAAIAGAEIRTGKHRLVRS
jgi:hypothetical protein